MQNQNIPWEAISAKLKGEAVAEDLKLIQVWLDSSDENSLILKEIVQVWSVTKTKPEYYQPDMSYNWDKLMEKIKYQPRQNRTYSLFVRIAAAAAVLALVFWAGMTVNDKTSHHSPAISYSKIISPKGNKTHIILPDSSTVWLNSGAEIWYPSNYSANNREVWMKGECYFQVEKDPNHPFLVHGNKLQVKVFGTCFNVKEDETKDLADVTLISGKVKVLDLQNETITDLIPGQQLIYAKGVGRVQQSPNLEASTSWINNILIFKNQPLEDVVHYLSGWYGVDIEFDRSLYSNHKYTFKVKTESLKEVLELITIITPIDYRIEGDQITIKYKQKMKS